jgi:hypothetical protein
MVNVLSFNDWIVDVDPFNDNPFGALPVTADILATGVLFATPVNANSALVVAVDPNNKSFVILAGSTVPRFCCQ